MPSPKGSRPPSSQLIERLQKRRTQLAFFQGIVFMMWQSAYMRITAGQLSFVRAVEHVNAAAYVILAILLMVFLARSGGFGWSKDVRRILNDEVTRDNRRRAFEIGFWAAMVAALACAVVQMFAPFPAFDALHIVLSAGLAGALLTFALLERRAQADG
ncbi:MAG TPA: hypothetical protein VHV27_04185 [Phenylobacterium sp.]|jgi:magnesium-transporting ATPase (P-type)|nr:hypothetical protein [Phenylobacterium sp.]